MVKEDHRYRHTTLFLVHISQMKAITKIKL